MIKELFSLEYHPELIRIMNQSSFLGAFASNILGMLFSLYILYDKIPIDYIYNLITFSILLFFMRIFMNFKSLECLRYVTCKNYKYLSVQLFLIILNAIFYIIILWTALAYDISDIDILILALIIFALVAGTIATLSSVFIAFLLYVTINFSSIILAMIYHSQDRVFYIYAFTIFVFSVVFLKAGYRHFQTLKSSIELKEEFEKKVKIEVEKNRTKDEHILSQSRLAQMGEMISMIAHQWRQPLTAISSTIINIDMKIDIGKFDFENRKDRELFLKFLYNKHGKIITYVNSLSETIDDFRTFFKPDKTKELTSIINPIQKALSIVEIKMSLNKINIIKEYQVSDNIEIYSNEMMQVILNILKNSEDNFEERDIKNPKIMITTKKDDSFYIIEISDNGGGISDNIIDNIFDPYFTTKDVKNGTGLGLYMSKTIIQEHNNGILTAKNIDNGVVFIIKLPI